MKWELLHSSILMRKIYTNRHPIVCSSNTMLLILRKLIWHHIYYEVRLICKIFLRSLVPVVLNKWSSQKYIDILLNLNHGNFQLLSWWFFCMVYEERNSYQIWFQMRNWISDMSNQSVSVFIEDVDTDNERTIQTGIGLVFRFRRNEV